MPPDNFIEPFETWLRRLGVHEHCIKEMCEQNNLCEPTEQVEYEVIEPKQLEPTDAPSDTGGK
jgi:hypothetical protein